MKTVENATDGTSELHRLRTLHLFAGAGGGILGDILLGHQPVCAVEINDYCQQVISQRQADGMLPWFPIFDDVTTFDGKPWRGHVDVISGGFPCQDISVAGRGDGLDGERSGLWSEMARIIGEVQPRFAFVENSPMLTSRGLDRVLGDLSSMGYDAEWGVVGADDAGAPHRRERIWILAYTNADRNGYRDGSDDWRGYGLHGQNRQTAPENAGRKECFDGFGTTCNQHPIGQPADTNVCGRLHGQAEELATSGGFDALGEPEPSGEDVADASRVYAQGQHHGQGEIQLGGGGWWSTEPYMGGMVDELAVGMDLHGAIAGEVFPRVASGVEKRADRLKAIGNGQVPAAAALAWTTLYERIQQRSK